jgi:putative membrane protein
MKTFRMLALAAAVASSPAMAQKDLNDLEMAHVAVTASNIDIAHAHLALALSENASVREFAETMIRDHTAVNAQVVALAKKLNVQAQDNAVSQRLLKDAARTRDELAKLRGTAFDRAYAANELKYHRAVNGLVEGTFIPQAKNAEVKQAFQAALTIFRGHERHAAQMVGQLGASR